MSGTRPVRRNRSGARVSSASKQASDTLDKPDDLAPKIHRIRDTFEGAPPTLDLKDVSRRIPCLHELGGERSVVFKPTVDRAPRHARLNAGPLHAPDCGKRRQEDLAFRLTAVSAQLPGAVTVSTATAVSKAATDCRGRRFVGFLLHVPKLSYAFRAPALGALEAEPAVTGRP